MPVWTIIIIGVTAGLLLFAFLIWMVVRIAYRTDKHWHKANPGIDVILSANGANCAAFPIPDSKSNLRGNGLLVLTEEELQFWMWTSDKRLTIPLSGITLIDTVRKFAGRWGRLPMLHIKFHSAGEILETAWILTNAQSWVEEIKGLKSGDAEWLLKND